MKIWLVAILVLSATCVFGQKNTNVSVGLAVQNDDAVTSFEVGKTYGLNSVSLVAQTYQSVNSDRQWDAGVKFSHTLYGKNTPLNLRVNATTLVSLTGTYQYVTVQPGLSINYALNKNFSLGFETCTPIYEGSVLFKPVSWQTGLRLQLIL